MVRGGRKLHQARGAAPSGKERPMIHVAWPWMALLLPLPWVLYLSRKPVEPSGSTAFVPMAMSLSAAPATDAAAASRVGRLIFGIIWLLLVAAAVRPQWLG